MPLVTNIFNYKYDPLINETIKKLNSICSFRTVKIRKRPNKFSELTFEPRKKKQWPAKIFFQKLI